MSKSKLGSGRSERFDTSFLRHVGHSLLPDRNAVTMQSEQKRCKHSLVVIVFLSMSRQMGHISSLCRLRGDTAISLLSTIASCGVRFSSYNDRSHVLFWGGSSDAIFLCMCVCVCICWRCSARPSWELLVGYGVVWLLQMLLCCWRWRFLRLCPTLILLNPDK